MSIESIRWAFAQDIKPSSVKFVLVSLADRVQDDGLCWPSVKRICMDTGLDRKAVIRALARLVEIGAITDTGERKGKTSSVKVLRVNSDMEAVPKAEQFPKGNSSQSGTGSSPQSGTSKQSPNGYIEPIRYLTNKIEPNTSSGDDMGDDSQTVMDTGDLHIDQPDLLDQVTTKPETSPPQVPLTPPVDCEAVADLYNEILPELPSVKLLTDKRRRSIRSCAKVRKGFESLEFWGDYFRSVRDSEFLMGRRTPWKADFDFLTTASKFTKVIEGSYS